MTSNVLVQNIKDAVTVRIPTEFRDIRTLIGGSAKATLVNLQTADKSSLVAALNEVRSVAAGAAALIDDTQSIATKVYSSQKVDVQVLALKNFLTNGAGTALDQFNELAAALGNDPNFATTMMTALSNRLRFDAAQTLNAAQQQQVQDNASVYARSQIGDPTTDFVAAFNTALNA